MATSSTVLLSSIEQLLLLILLIEDLTPYSPINQDASVHDKIPLHNMLNSGDEKINKMGDKYAHEMQQQCHLHETIPDTMGKP